MTLRLVAIKFVGDTNYSKQKKMLTRRAAHPRKVTRCSILPQRALYHGSPRFCLREEVFFLKDLT